jgi:type IV pilus assembly protein PilB
MLGEGLSNSYIDLEKVTFSQEVLRLVPRSIAIKYCLIPFGVNDTSVCIAMRDTQDMEVIGYLRLLCKRQVIPYSANVYQIYSMIENYYQGTNIERAVEDLIRRHDENTISSKNYIHREVESENAPAVQITEHLINKAILKKASDIHIEPYTKGVLIRYRIDGVLFEEISIPLNIYGAVSTRLKIMCDMDISEKRIPQDGKFEHTFGDREYDLRISSLPTMYGEKFVIRILYKNSNFCNLIGISLREKELNLVKKMIKASHGIILVTGPTGSGKSTTLYAMLNELNNREKNITTIEDPVEYRMPGINQVNVNPKAKITFASGLRSILRQDPDIIMIGEIRDEETAAIAIRAAITGHLVITTLHTNDAIGAIPRLIEMGIERYLLADCLIGVVAQRLVRKICNECSEEYDPPEIENKILNIDYGRKLFKGRGCVKCNNSGYSGRRAVCEVLMIDNRQREFILSDNSTKSLRKSCFGHMRTIKDDCRELVLEGITTYDEFIKLNNIEFSNKL